MKRSIIKVAALLMCTSLCACSSNGTNGANATNDTNNAQVTETTTESTMNTNFVGKWAGTKSSVDILGDPVTVASMTFNEDGTGNYKTKNEDRDFTWSTESSSSDFATITFSDDNTTERCNYNTSENFISCKGTKLKKGDVAMNSYNGHKIVSLEDFKKAVEVVHLDTENWKNYFTYYSTETEIKDAYGTVTDISVYAGYHYKEDVIAFSPQADLVYKAIDNNSYTLNIDYSGITIWRPFTHSVLDENRDTVLNKYGKPLMVPYDESEFECTSASGKLFVINLPSDYWFSDIDNGYKKCIYIGDEYEYFLFGYAELGFTGSNFLDEFLQK